MIPGRSCRGGSKYQCSNYQLNQNTWEIMSWGLPTYVESYSSLTETSTRAPARYQHFEDDGDDDDVVC